MSELEQVRTARVALSEIAEPGNLALWRRVSRYGPVAVLEGLVAQGAAGAPSLFTTGDAAESIDPRRRAAESLALAQRLGARVVIPEDDEWPAQLDDLLKICGKGGGDPVDRDAAPPLCLWVRGQQRLDEALARSVAVVGARAATGYGGHVAREIGYGLADAGWFVVSGGAFGIDAHAHRGALAAGGGTAAVLACGVERAYPLAHANLFDQITEQGLLVSEWAPGADPFRHRFLIRNRVIAAATVGTVLVEAGARSGARQTLRRARELGRRQLVVPGPVTSAMSVGSHEELRQPYDPPARLVTGVAQILEEVGRIGSDLAPPVRGPDQPRDRLGTTERRLVEALRRRAPLTAEQAAARAGVPLADAVRILPVLVLSGHAERHGDGFVAARRPGGAGSPAGS